MKVVLHESESENGIQIETVGWMDVAKSIQIKQKSLYVALKAAWIWHESQFNTIVVSKIDLQRNSSPKSKLEKNNLQHHLLVDKQELNWSLLNWICNAIITMRQLSLASYRIHQLFAVEWGLQSPLSSKSFRSSMFLPRGSTAEAWWCFYVPRR